MPKIAEQKIAGWPKVSIVIPVYNMAHTIQETVKSCFWQQYVNTEIIVYDDCSTDKIDLDMLKFYCAKYYRGEKNIGVGEAFNAAIKLSTGDIVVFMCGDDLFTNDFVIWDIVCQFVKFPGCGVVVRWYYQFIDSDPERKPCRAWRTGDPCLQANNPSGLAFRREALDGRKCSNRMFIESSYLVKAVTMDLWGWVGLQYDSVAVRVHGSTSTTPGYWLKRRVSSPVMDWWSLGVKSIAQD